MSRSQWIAWAMSVSLLGCKGPTSTEPAQGVPKDRVESGAPPSTSPGPPAAGPKRPPNLPTSKEAEFVDAALNGSKESVAATLASGMSVNATDEIGSTALMTAAFNGHTELVSYLLEKGASVNLRDRAGRTALIYASSGPNLETVKTLLDAGADINVQDKDEHWSALMFAASEGMTDIVALLLDRGANRMLKDVDGDTALDFANQNHHAEAASLLSRP